jgi:hypothetical protein
MERAAQDFVRLFLLQFHTNQLHLHFNSEKYYLWKKDPVYCFVY